MLRKIMLLWGVIMALAAIAAPGAQAEPLVKNFFNEAAGTIVAESENTVTSFTFGGGSLACNTVQFDIHLNVNNTSTAEGSGTGASNGTPPFGHVGHCAFAGVVPTHVDSFSVSSFHLDDDGSGLMSLEFTITITHPTLGAIMCRNIGTANITYSPGSSSIKVNGSTIGTENIPPCGTGGTIKGDFTVSDEFGPHALIG